MAWWVRVMGITRTQVATVLRAPRDMPRVSTQEEAVKFSPRPDEGGAGFFVPAGGPQVVLRGQGRCFRARVSGLDPDRVRGGKRGKIGGFSRGSRLRLTERLQSIDWSAQEVRFLTLTYHTAPAPEVVQGHLQAFRKRIERRWGKQGEVWRMELQKRGACHWHLLLWGCFIPWEWVSQAWSEVVGEWCYTRLSIISDPRRAARYVAKYVAKEVGEAAAVTAPAPEGAAAAVAPAILDSKTYLAVGRHWGVRNKGLIPWGEVTEVVWDFAEWFYRLRRQARHLWSRVPKRRGQGFLLFTDDQGGWWRLAALCVAGECSAIPAAEA